MFRNVQFENNGKHFYILHFGVYLIECFMIICSVIDFFGGSIAEIEKIWIWECF